MHTFYIMQNRMKRDCHSSQVREQGVHQATATTTSISEDSNSNQMILSNQQIALAFSLLQLAGVVSPSLSLSLSFFVIRSRIKKLNGIKTSKRERERERERESEREKAH